VSIPVEEFSFAFVFGLLAWAACAVEGLSVVARVVRAKGEIVFFQVGSGVNKALGLLVVGESEKGFCEGKGSVGKSDGTAVGRGVGNAVGGGDGLAVGGCVDFAVGAGVVVVGLVVGDGVGADVGFGYNSVG